MVAILVPVYSATKDLWSAEGTEGLVYRRIPPWPDYFADGCPSIL